MKNTKSSSVPVILFSFLAIAAFVAIYWGISAMFVALTGDELRSDANGLIYVTSIIFFAIATLRADDERTFHLSMVFGGFFFVLGAILFVANATFTSVGGDMKKMSEALVWAIPFTWTLPVLIGMLFFVHQSLDRYWGQDKKPISEASQSKFVTILYGLLYNLGIFGALIASAFGTYSVMYTITHSFWHAMVYVGTVEFAIYAFASFTHKTKDVEVFWYSFGLTLLFFGFAMMFQLVSALDTLFGGLNDANSAQAFAQNFVLLPPFIAGGLAGLLYIYNQRKTPVLMDDAKPKGGFTPRSEKSEVRPAKFQNNKTNPQPTQAATEGNADRVPKDREDVDALKALGYSNKAIWKMSEQEAKNRIAKKTPPRPDQRSGNQPSQNSKSKQTQSTNSKTNNVSPESDDGDDESEQVFDGDYVKSNGNGQNPTKPS